MRSHGAKSVSYLRNFTFGVEDSLGSTVGLLSGVAAAGVPRSTIIVTGLILIFTEALSMGVGSFLSEQSVEEFERRRNLPWGESVPGAITMFLSYLLAGLLPIAPYVVWSLPMALYSSVAAAVVGLVVLGALNAKIAHTSAVKQMARMGLLGGSVAVAGVMVGEILKSWGGMG